ncbi:sacsin N-terminal ATP-binding-like domain-containing protein [Thermoanaerobaculum aquaticum]|uniref:sacsin N-terminal ATP-binding-like domain-containing protein n=1 Tax=Thermoanaerobaculum aquaticum TaxID=1312852 RepID=UPI0009DD7A92|nr:ATP-binding protein [Thermoanaerobaculum aquaticum]
MSARKLPPYFTKVRERACRRWEQLENDPELAGPWRQLFGQVQSPRHVLSELLQNADDAGAKAVRVSFQNDDFVFEHNGRDFNEEDFSSLCRFGFSNKRTLHTIGFRGVGFKSLFSLGDTVELLTPTLAVRFHRSRFTEPSWINDAPPCEVTRVCVKVKDRHRADELRKNLQDWTESPFSLLFFNSILEITINGATLRRIRMGQGPVKCSERFKLVARNEYDVLVFFSPEEPLPKDALDEIRQERNVEDLHLPPSRVEIVLGMPGTQRLFVVLPTGVAIDTPFSCNAPFIQDPARSAIKDPSLSPTNRWLLGRLGRLAGEVMLEWLGNRSLGTTDRARAYELLPNQPVETVSLDSSVTSAICAAFNEVVGSSRMLLDFRGHVFSAGSCISVPEKLYRVWDPPQIAEVFRPETGGARRNVLCGAVSDDQRKRLASWGWLEHWEEDRLVQCLENNPRVPRPPDDKLLLLWSVVQKSVPWSYRGTGRIRQLSIAPIQGSDVLAPAESTVRLPSKKETLSDDAWRFLEELVRTVDPDWLRFLGKKKEQPNEESEAALELLEDIGLDRPSPTDAVAVQACEALFAQSDVSLTEHVQMAQLLAALDAKAPLQFRAITRDGKSRRLSEGLVVPYLPGSEELYPEDWAAAHLLHEAYWNEFRLCTRRQWEDWVASEKSGFWPFAPLVRQQGRINSRDGLKKELRRRNVDPPGMFPYVTENFVIVDYDFDSHLLEHWEKKAESDDEYWGRIAEAVIRAPSFYWDSRVEAIISQISTSWNQREVARAPAAWIVRFWSQNCLPDTWGKVRVPAELYLRSPETEPLQDVEPFVRGDLDTEQTEPLLRLLGVRDTLAGVDKLLGRIRALAQEPAPSRLLPEIGKWYRALDKAMLQCGEEEMEQVRQAFAGEALILTSDLKWARASEVFQYESAEIGPEIPVVHPAMNEVRLWAYVGVCERPTPELMLKWLQNLPSGRQLDQTLRRRVSGILQRYPLEVWDTCHHWLSLDGRWTPVAQLKYRISRNSAEPRVAFFPQVKAATADLRMVLSLDPCKVQPFAALTDLETSVEFQLIQDPVTIGQPSQPDWIVALARELQRVRFDDENKTHHIRQTAAELEKLRWQPVAQGSIRVTPYLNGSPAGEARALDVFWHRKRGAIYVADGKAARHFEALVTELARPFGHERITESIRACIGREYEFIVEYLREHLPLDLDGSGIREEQGQDARVNEDETNPQGLAAEDEVALPAEPEDEGEGEHIIRSVPKRKRRLAVFWKFANAKGFRWDKTKKVFVHDDGHIITRDGRAWLCLTGNGNPVSYWVAKQPLERGVEIPAEIWEHFKFEPEHWSLIVPNSESSVREIRGVDLLRMVENQEVVVSPAQYRLRKGNHDDDLVR